MSEISGVKMVDVDGEMVYVPDLLAEVRRLRSDLAELQDAERVHSGMIETLRAASPRDAVILADVYRALRIASESIGDNTWPDNLHPADVIDKHIMRPTARLRSDDWLEKAAEEIARWATQIDSVTPADPRDASFVLAILKQFRDGK